jgi:hypothetical protein
MAKTRPASLFLGTGGNVEQRELFPRTRLTILVAVAACYFFSFFVVQNHTVRPNVAVALSKRGRFQTDKEEAQRAHRIKRRIGGSSYHFVRFTDAASFRT